MEGTHNPIKVPSAFSPLKKRNSENNNDNIAAVNNSLSAVVNFLSITFFFAFREIYSIYFRLSSVVLHIIKLIKLTPMITLILIIKILYCFDRNNNGYIKF